MSKKIAEELDNGRRGTRGPDHAWLQRVPGTSAFNAKHRQDLAVHRAWLGPPTAFVTVTCSSATRDNFASWVADEARARGNKVDVITARDERERFSLRPGFPEHVEQVETVYAVHSQADGEWPDNCPYHPGCHRESLADYAQQ